MFLKFFFSLLFFLYCSK